MPSRFEECLKFVLAHEGGKVDDPADRGGRTNQGITQRTYDAYRTKHGRPAKDVYDIEPSEVRDIYLGGYWGPMCCASLPVGLDLCAMDAAVNCGPRRAAKWLQEAIGMDAGDIDGVIGQGTLRYVHDVIAANEVDRVIELYQELRGDHYVALIARDPSQRRFVNGWTRRLDECTEAALECRA